MNAHPETPQPIRRRLLPVAVCVLAGIMLTTALPPFRGTALLAPLALAILFEVLRRDERPGRAAFWFGVGHAATLLIWLFSLDPAKSIPTRALVPIQAAATVLFVAAHYWLCGLVVGVVRRRLDGRFTLAVLPVLWVATELLRTVGEMGFPWCLTGAAWLETPLRPLYRACGEIGLSAATALTAAALVAVADLVRRIDRAVLHRYGLLGLTALLWGGLAVGSRPLPVESAAGARTEPVTVACIQADVAQADKWDDAKIDSTRIPYTDLTARAARDGAELAVWAETAVPAYLRYERELLDWVRITARDNGIAILTGFPDAEILESRGPDGKPRYRKFNSSGLFSPQGTLQHRYAKHHLLPIGETMPYQRWLPALGDIDVGQAEWTPGDPPGPMPLVTHRGDLSVFTLICYEAVFGDLARQAVRRGGTVMVNITNDGWFGVASGPRQHAALARIHATACGVPLVRCANNGISMICDADGRVLAQLGLHRRGEITAVIDPVPRGTWYVRLGPWPVLLLLALWIPVAWLLVRADGGRDPARRRS